MYSQNNEESVILSVLGDLPVGRFLDIGAYDGKTFSNTLALAEKGWTGVCVEPSPGPFNALLALHGKRDGIKLVNAAVAAVPGLMPFYDSGGDAVSTLDTEHVKKWTAGYGSAFSTFYTNAITMPMLFETFGLDYQFINLDVESANLVLFSLIPLEKLPQLKLICVEHDGHYDEMERGASLFGFTRIAFNGENIILAR
jgi:FkbM family methyltransferase